VKGAFTPRLILQRGRGRIGCHVASVDGIDLLERHADMELNAGASVGPGALGEKLRLGSAQQHP
jgi:hypothetical protein